MEGQQQKKEFEYKSMLARYMQIVAYVEGVHFINECPTEPNDVIPFFTEEEVTEMYRLFDEFNSEA